MKVQKRIQAFSFLLLINFIAYSQQKVFHLEDLNKLTSISALSISPDGQSAIFMTSNRNMETNSFDRALMLLTIVNKEVRQIADQFERIGSPMWTENGEAISFFGNLDAVRQLYVMNVKTGACSVILDAATNATRYAWSPNGKRIAYFVRTSPASGNKNKFNDSFEVGSNDYLVEGMTPITSVWLADSDGQNAMQITPEEFTVGTGLTTSSIAWSPDSKMIAFTKYPTANSGDSDLGRNFIYDLDSKKLEAVTSNTQRESSPIFSMDGASLIYRYPRHGFPSNMYDLHQIDLESGEIENMTETFDKASSGLSWTSKGVPVVRAIDHYGNMLYQLNGVNSTRINTGTLASVRSFSMSETGSMVLTATKKNYPVEIYYKKDLKAKPEQLTDFHAFIKEIKLGMQEGMEWSSGDGLTPTGILTYPPDFDPKKQYPLVLQIHGGPSASSLLGFSPVTQAMAAKGWIVFQPNYRGSTNLGNKFQWAISKDPSEGPGHDVITGVNVLKEKPYIDEERIGVSGWSYGGWMTSWLIGRYPDVWTAAVSGAAPVDFTDMYSLNDLNRMRRHSIVESPYVGDNLSWAYENSPISNFSKLKTPTLIMSKTGDARVTITGSYKLYGALRDNNVPVAFIAYPGPGHFPRDPVRSLDVYTRWIGWLEKYLGDGKDALESAIEDK